MKFVHVSDVHLSVPGDRVEGYDPHKRLNQCLAHIAQHHGDAARVVITGDLTHWGEAEAYQALRTVIAETDLTIRLLIGNHDNRAVFRETFFDHPTDDHGFINHAEALEVGRFIYCDTNEPGTHAGHFGPERRAWLETQLTAADDGAYLFFHHNPAEIRQPAMDQIGLVTDDRDALRALLRRYRDRIRYLFFGHTHLTVSGQFAGIPFACVRATVHQSLPDFSDRRELTGGELDPYYAVVLVEEDDVLVHQIPFLYDGPVHLSGVAWDDWTKPST
ncbi:MAG: metallophosphoesterase [Geminicoccaceae bacterium]